VTQLGSFRSTKVSDIRTDLSKLSLIQLLFPGVDKHTGALMFASEMKCLVERCDQIEAFPPGYYLYGKLTEPMPPCQRFFAPSWFVNVPKTPVDFKALRQSLEAAVRSHLQCEVSFGALLSGGVDSSLIASIATKVMRESVPDFKLRTYSVGLENAPDFKYSKMVAQYLDSEHTEVHFTVDQGLDYIRETIYFLESYDVTSIRSSIPMVVLARHIKADGLKMVLSGEGADEILGGYLYFFQAPTPDDFHHETVSRVQNLHLSDCLRANKSTAAWGVELRVPFLDAGFLDHSMRIAPEDRMPIRTAEKQRIEKYALRKAFEDGYLPDEVLWRQKEQFSDGVGYSWIDEIKKHTSTLVSDVDFAQARTLSTQHAHNEGGVLLSPDFHGNVPARIVRQNRYEVGATH
jgi:asparagine synthase (glutamine-hydrolysing)